MQLPFQLTVLCFQLVPLPSFCFVFRIQGLELPLQQHPHRSLPGCLLVVGRNDERRRRGGGLHGGSHGRRVRHLVALLRRERGGRGLDALALHRVTAVGVSVAGRRRLQRGHGVERRRLHCRGAVLLQQALCVWVQSRHEALALDGEVSVEGPESSPGARADIRFSVASDSSDNHVADGVRVLLQRGRLPPLQAEQKELHASCAKGGVALVCACVNEAGEHSRMLGVHKHLGARDTSRVCRHFDRRRRQLERMRHKVVDNQALKGLLRLHSLSEGPQHRTHSQDDPGTRVHELLENGLHTGAHQACEPFCLRSTPLQELFQLVEFLLPEFPVRFFRVAQIAENSLELGLECIDRYHKFNCPFFLRFRDLRGGSLRHIAWCRVSFPWGFIHLEIEF
mmetsp:Transcript_9437/g.21565  ORF Transcript_9437/g.21565 Transcript_9437/m.21565 type:complete len:395 (+) Transcript_9437:1078-2262(+)